MKTTTTVLAGRSEAVHKMLKKFAKKAARYGVPFTFSVGEVYVKTAKEMKTESWYPGGESRVRYRATRVMDVTITGEKPVVGDYEFLASIEHTSAGNFVDTAPGVVNDAEWRTTDDRCEHCNTARRRKNVFIVRNRVDGSVTQVGRTCLRDFMGIDDPKSIVQRFRFFRELAEFGEDEGWASYEGDEVYYLNDVLAVGLASVRIWGWCSMGMARADENLTATLSRYWLLGSDSKYDVEDKARLKAEIKPADFKVAAEIVEWVRGLENCNDYLWNLQVAFQDDTILGARRLGLVMSAIQAFHRAAERALRLQKEKEEAGNSKWVGDVGVRLTELEVRCTLRRGMGDNGYGGYSELLKFVDLGGNVFTWFSASAPSFDVGENLVIAGMVKRHSDYQGAQETQLTRVKIAA